MAGDGLAQSLIQAAAQDVSLAVEFMKVMSGQWMPNRLRFVRRRQVLFGHVSRVNGLIDQNMVPRLVFRGPGAGDLFIPFVRPAEDRIHVEHNAQIIEQPMTNDFADLKFGFLSTHGSFRGYGTGFDDSIICAKTQKL